MFHFFFEQDHINWTPVTHLKISEKKTMGYILDAWYCHIRNSVHNLFFLRKFAKLFFSINSNFIIYTYSVSLLLQSAEPVFEGYNMDHTIP